MNFEDSNFEETLNFLEMIFEEVNFEDWNFMKPFV